MYLGKYFVTKFGALLQSRDLSEKMTFIANDILQEIL